MNQATQIQLAFILQNPKHHLKTSYNLGESGRQSLVTKEEQAKKLRLGSQHKSGIYYQEEGDKYPQCVLTSLTSVFTMLASWRYAKQLLCLVTNISTTDGSKVSLTYMCFKQVSKNRAVKTAVFLVLPISYSYFVLLIYSISKEKIFLFPKRLNKFVSNLISLSRLFTYK